MSLTDSKRFRVLLFFSLGLVVIIFLTGVFRNTTITDMTQITSVTIRDQKIEVEIADSRSKQVKGLSGRDELCDNCGMLFVYKEPKPQRFWMQGMLFPLDIIFIRGDRVVGIFSDVPEPKGLETPAAVNSPAPADLVLELNAGAASKLGLSIGDTVSYGYPL